MFAMFRAFLYFGHCSIRVSPDFHGSLQNHDLQKQLAKYDHFANIMLMILELNVLKSPSHHSEGLFVVMKREERRAQELQKSNAFAHFGVSNSRCS